MIIPGAHNIAFGIAEYFAKYDNPTRMSQTPPDGFHGLIEFNGAASGSGHVPPPYPSPDSHPIAEPSAPQLNELGPAAPVSGQDFYYIIDEEEEEQQQQEPLLQPQQVLQYLEQQQQQLYPFPNQALPPEQAFYYEPVQDHPGSGQPSYYFGQPVEQFEGVYPVQPYLDEESTQEYPAEEQHPVEQFSAEEQASPIEIAAPPTPPASLTEPLTENDTQSAIRAKRLEIYLGFAKKAIDVEYNVSQLKFVSSSIPELSPTQLERLTDCVKRTLKLLRDITEQLVAVPDSADSLSLLSEALFLRKKLADVWFYLVERISERNPPLQNLIIEVYLGLKAAFELVDLGAKSARKQLQEQKQGLQDELNDPMGLELLSRLRQIFTGWQKPKEPVPGSSPDEPGRGSGGEQPARQENHQDFLSNSSRKRRWVSEYSVSV